jgi:hypothetical protein
MESTSIFTFSTPTRCESGSTASGAAEAAVKTEAAVKAEAAVINTRAPDAGGVEAHPNYRYSVFLALLVQKGEEKKSRNGWKIY